MAVVDSGFNQTSAGGLDDADSLLCILRGLDLKSGWNKTEVFIAVIKPELLAYLSNGSFVSNVILNKLFALTSKCGTKYMACYSGVIIVVEGDYLLLRLR